MESNSVGKVYQHAHAKNPMVLFGNATDVPFMGRTVTQDATNSNADVFTPLSTVSYAASTSNGSSSGE